MNRALGRILEPRSVVVVGASRDPAKRGHRAVQALLESSYEGAIHPVHPGGGELLGLRVARSLDDVPENLDVAYLATPAETIPPIVEACGRRGLGGAIIPAVGFSESGPVGADLEQAIVEAATAGGVRLVGPNTAGLMNPGIGLNLVGIPDVRRGSLAIISQSGNVALDLVNRASANGPGVSLYVGVGNAVDIGFADCLEFLAGHEPTRVVAVYAEGVGAGREFLAAARRVGVRKPVVLLKGGRSARGTEAIRSHTGVVAGSYRVFSALAREAGIVEVQRSDELLPVARALGSQPAPEGEAAVAILADGGGQGTIAADALGRLDVPLAALADRTTAALRELLGRAAALGNPVDVAGATDRDPELFGRAVEVLADDPSVGLIWLVGLFGGYGVRFAPELAAAETAAARRMVEVVGEAGRALIVHTMYADVDPEAVTALRRGGIPVTASIETAARCAWALRRRAAARPARLAAGARSAAPAEPGETVPAAAALLESVAVSGRRGLTEPEARELVAAYGVPVAPAEHCRTPAEAAAAAAAYRGVVAIKAVSPGAHKARRGGVALDVRPNRVAEAFREVCDALERAGSVTPDGVIVSPMLPSPAAELLVGVRRDPVYGPVLTVGAGGVAVELLDDVAIRALPVAGGEMAKMVAGLRMARLWEASARGIDLTGLDHLAASLCRCALAHPSIVEIELNPVFVYEDRVAAVDARAFIEPGPSASR